jgi:hypothetical protein
MAEMTGCQMVIANWSKAARIRWLAGTSVAVGLFLIRQAEDICDLSQPEA